MIMTSSFSPSGSIGLTLPPVEVVLGPGQGIKLKNYLGKLAPCASFLHTKAQSASHTQSIQGWNNTLYQFILTSYGNLPTQKPIFACQYSSVLDSCQYQ